MRGPLQSALIDLAERLLRQSERARSEKGRSDWVVKTKMRLANVFTDAAAHRFPKSLSKRFPNEEPQYDA